MTEERITITINEDGTLQLETKGIKGPVCMDEAQALLEGIAVQVRAERTDEFYMKQKAGVRPSLEVGRG